MNNQEFLNKIISWVEDKLYNYEFINEIEIYKYENYSEYNYTNYELSIRFPEIPIPYFIRITVKENKIYCELDDTRIFECEINLNLLDELVAKRQEIIKEYIIDFINHN